MGEKVAARNGSSSLRSQVTRRSMARVTSALDGYDRRLMNLSAAG
jgi:hypothetical protein